MMFHHAELLFWLIPVVGIWIFCLISWWRAGRQKMSPAIVEGSTLFLMAKRSLIFLAMLFLLFALSSPEGNPHYSQEEVKLEERERVNRRPLFFVIDDSKSMLVKDCLDGRDRLDCAKGFIEKTIDRFPGVPMAVFGADRELVLLSPKTIDTFYVRMMVDALTADEGGTPGTDYVAILRAIVERVKNLSPLPVILFLSDGGDTFFEMGNSEERVERIKELLTLSRKGPQVHTVAFGSVAGAAIPDLLYKGKAHITRRLDEPLQAISKASGGKFIVFGDEASQELLLEEIKKSFNIEIGEQKERKGAGIHYDDYSMAPLLIALMTLLLFWALPETCLRAFLFLVGTTQLLYSSENEIEMIIRTGECEGLIEALSSHPPENEWQKGAILFDKAICLLKEGNRKEALDILERMDFDATADPKIVQLHAFLLAYSMDDPFLAWQMARLLPGEGAKILSAMLIQAHPPMKEGLYPALTLALEWKNRVSLTQQQKELHSFFDQDERFQYFDGKSTLASAFIHYLQNDLVESESLFTKAEKELIQQAEEMPKAELFEPLFSSISRSIYDLDAFQKVTIAAGDIQAPFFSGNRVVVEKILAINSLMDIEKSPYPKNPIVYGETLLFQYKRVLSLLRIEKWFSIASEISSFLPTMKEGILNFWTSVVSFQKEQFVKKGLCFSWEKASMAMGKIPSLQKKLRDSVEKKRLIESIAQVKAICAYLEEALKVMRSKENRSQNSQETSSQDAMSQFQDLQIMDQDLFLKKGRESLQGYPW